MSVRIATRGKEVIAAKIGALDKRRCFQLRGGAQRFEQRGSFWSIRGGFVRKVVVLLHYMLLRCF